MKKILSAILFVTVAITGCSSKKAAVAKDVAAFSNVSFEYETTTRGSYHKVIAKQDTLVMIDGRDKPEVTTATLDKKDWEALVEAAKNINPESLESLKAPSGKRFYDGAAIATLSLIKDGTAYKSAPFDHGNPPAEIKTLTDGIIGLTAKYKK